MNFSQDMAQRLSWGLAENGLFYFGLASIDSKSQWTNFNLRYRASRQAFIESWIYCFEHSAILCSWKNSSDLQRWITHRLWLGEVQFFATLLGFLDFSQNRREQYGFFIQFIRYDWFYIFSPTKAYKHCGLFWRNVTQKYCVESACQSKISSHIHLEK